MEAMRLLELLAKAKPDALASMQRNNMPVQAPPPELRHPREAQRGAEMMSVGAFADKPGNTVLAEMPMGMRDLQSLTRLAGSTSADDFAKQFSNWSVSQEDILASPEQARNSYLGRIVGIPDRVMRGSKGTPLIRELPNGLKVHGNKLKYGGGTVELVDPKGHQAGRMEFAKDGGVENFAVRADFQKQGMGQELMRTAQKLGFNPTQGKLRSPDFARAVHRFLKP